MERIEKRSNHGKNQGENNRGDRNDRGHVFIGKILYLLRFIREEAIKMTFIGKNMLKASNTNTQLHKTYEELGQLASLAVKNGDLKWDNPKAIELLKAIENCQEGLIACEDEVKNIKQTPPPTPPKDV